MKEKIKKLMLYDIEKVLLKNLTSVSFYLILILFIFQIIYKFSEWSTFITIIGGVIVFWYGYKRYERDKELEIIEKYSKKYNEINNNLYFLKENIQQNKNEIKRKYEDLFNLFYEEFYLKSKGYISDDLWNEWENWIEIDIYNFLDFSINKLFGLNDYDIFISNIYGNFLQYHSENNIKDKGINFLDFIDKKILKIRDSYSKEIEEKKLGYSEEEYSKMKEMLIWLESIIEVNKKIKKI